MNDYEILLMIDPELPEERGGEIVTRTRELVEKAGGNWEDYSSPGAGGSSPTRSTTSPRRLPPNDLRASRRRWTRSPASEDHGRGDAPPGDAASASASPQQSRSPS